MAEAASRQPAKAGARASPPARSRGPAGSLDGHRPAGPFGPQPSARQPDELRAPAARGHAREKELLHAREDERTRIGRELHDSTSQLLVGLKICLMRLKETGDSSKVPGIIGEMDELLLDIDHEIRSISFLLHPPRLQGRGLADAIRYMVRGFARRSGLDVRVDVEGDLAAPPPDVAVAIYRLAQEALTNVYRHAAATTVKVHLIARRGSVIHLLIEDDGIGLAATPARSPEPGVGIEGMFARVSELGGRFSLRSAGRGCRITASIPRRREARGRALA